MDNLSKASPSFFLELGGVQRGFEYTIHSIGQIKRLTGKNPMKGQVDVNDPDDLATLVWAGLITWDETLDGKIIESSEEGKPGTPDQSVTDAIIQVQKWMRFDLLSSIGQAVKKAFDAAAPDAPKKK